MAGAVFLGERSMKVARFTGLGSKVRSSCIVGTLLLGALVGVATLPNTAALADGPDRANIRVMTQNTYVGSDYQAIVDAKTPAEFAAAVTLTYQQILASDPKARAAAVAREIVRNQPDLVALQEADIVRTGAAPATNVQSDQLKALLAALRAQGQPYQPVAIVPELDAEYPSTLGFDVRISARNVILARVGRVRVSNLQAQTFAVNQVFQSAVGSITFRNGWTSVDAVVGGRAFRFVTTHLEASPPFTTQLAQARDLVASAANTRLPVVFAGDFNTTANDPQNPTFPTYQFLLDSGFVDAWAKKNPGNPGFTCCQAPDLRNPVSALIARIDLVLFRGGFDVADVHRVGDRQSDRTPSGLWPSDHAGVVATLRLPDRGYGG
ncbi:MULTISPECIES: endonuclease/exonuclease/phosphatase family protein [unclassified Frankia]|uniref:endonuclease/exonuclease/phosphatase family protein n=1 Tax=unclassified Frankia TaxID=2632575 RepID=UPI0013043CFD|nr:MULTISPECIES: endonuclease/exonuclease/phosphatase family protein [unclassified Frankia]